MKKQKCDKCGNEVRRRNLKRINGNWVCKKCYGEKRDKMRENLTRNVLKISKEQEQEEDEIIKKEEKKKYLEKNREKIKKYHREYSKKRRKITPKIKKSAVPKIKPIKVNRPRISALGLFITKVEKQVLWRKLKRKGLTNQEANKRINKLCNKMSMIASKLKEKVKTQEELNRRFKEEFGKLCEELQ